MRTVIPTLLLLVILLVSDSSAQAIVVGPNVNIVSPPDRQQAEPTIAVHPLQPTIVVAGAQDYNFDAERQHRWHAYYRSIDGGQTWTRSLLPGFPGDTSPEGKRSPLKKFELTSDPWLAFDRSGNVYYAGIGIKFEPGPFRATFVAKYTNDGATFDGATIVRDVGTDYPKIAVDVTGGSNDGNIYLTTSSGDFARSTDGGKTFSKAIRLPGSPTGIAVNPQGDVYVVSLDCHLDPVTFDCATRFIVVSRLTNGGSVLAGTSIVADPITGLPDPLPGNSFRTFTLPVIAADDSGVHVVWDDFGTGDADVLFSRSIDGGVTWSSPMRVNDVTTNHQFFPSIVSRAGTISIAWYDSRLDDGGTIQKLDVFYAKSTDAGFSFSSNLRVTDLSFDPNSVDYRDFVRFGPFMGDYIQVAATATEVHVVWTDNRNACDLVDPSLGCIDSDIFTARVTM